ncbi:hypothetical protein [Streptomyces phaeoluteigriseus]
MPKAGISYGPRIKAPDYDQIVEAATTSVMQTFGVKRPEDFVGKRPEDLLVKASEIVRQADAEMALHIDERDEALAHLWFYDPRLGLARTAGLSTMGYRGAIARVIYGDKKHALPEVQSNEELAKIGKALKVKRVKDPEAQLLRAAPIVRAARTRRELAVRFMQEAVLALSRKPYDWKPEKIAEHAGVERELIYKQRATAAKRHGLA